jgi:DNA-binding transcriptional LysR family regulator
MRQNISDLLAFLAVARERSFTRAAAQLGVSPSALSHTLKGLESRLGVRLLTRTTRSVSPTEAGERLLQTIGPRFQDIEHELDALTELRDKPAGTIRITATDYATDKVLWPRLAKVLTQYPDVKVEIVIDYGLVDIVEQRFDIGVRLGGQVAKDMIAVRIAPDMKMAIVGSPAYLANRDSPKLPADLTAHNCIGLRLPTHGGVYAWELKRENANCRFESTVSSHAMARIKCSVPPSTASDLPFYLTTWWRIMSTPGNWCTYWSRGAPPSPGCISSMQAAGRCPAPWALSSTPCAIAPDATPPCTANLINNLENAINNSYYLLINSF